MTRGAFALWLAVVAAEGVALVMAVRRWRGDRLLTPASSFSTSSEGAKQEALAPVVALLAFAVLEDVTVRVLIDLVIAQAPRPLRGAPLGAYFVSTGLVMAWPGALAGAAWRVFGESQKHAGPDRLGRSGPSLWATAAGAPANTMRLFSGPVKPLDCLVAVYLGTVAALVSMHPLGARATSQVLLAWELVALGFAVVAIVRGWRRAVRGEAAWTVAHGVLLVLVPVEAAVCAIGPFARPDLFSAWWVARWQYLAAFGIVAGLLGFRRAG